MKAKIDHSKPMQMTVRIGGRKMILTRRPRKQMSRLLWRMLSVAWKTFIGSVLAAVSAMSTVSYAQTAANALPTHGQIVAGQATISQAGNHMQVVQGTNSAIINWNTFNIGSQASVNFQQPTNTSVVLNRVLSNNPSALMGTLSANGHVWLINQAGIMVGQNAQIDVARFVGSTLNVRDEDFLAGKLMFQNTPGAGRIDNFGRIATPYGGSVYLVAPNVENQGVIRAPGGEVLLAAGQTVELRDTATPGVKIEITGAEGSVTNLGDVISEAGRIGMAGVLVKNSGNVNASSVVSEGGRIFLRAKDSLTTEATSQIRADGTKGGEVILYADNEARLAGDISAKGSDGPGGFVETSGKTILSLAKAPEISAGGTWLIDPANITISAGEDTNTDTSVAGGEVIYTPYNSSAVITPTTIQNSLNSGINVRIETGWNGIDDGDIIVASPISKTAGGDASLTLRAHNNINVNAAITSTAGKLDLNLVPDMDSMYGGVSSISANLDLNGGMLSTSGPLVLNNITVNNVRLNTYDATVAGSTILNSSTWDNNGLTTINGTLTLNSGSQLNNQSASYAYIDNAGSVVINSAATLNNLAGATVQIAETSTSSSPISVSGTGLFNNEGDFDKYNGNSISLYGFSNAATGSTYIGAGSLELTGTQAQSGSFYISDGATLRLNGNQTLTEGIEFDGDGTLRWSGTVNLATPLVFANNLGEMMLQMGDEPPPVESNIRLEIVNATINGSAVNTLTTDGIDDNAAMLYGSNTLGADTVWNNSGYTLNFGTLNLNSGSQYNNLGTGYTYLMDSGSISINSGAALNNHQFGTVELHPTSTHANPISASGTGVFNNHGYFDKINFANVTISGLSNAADGWVNFVEDNGNGYFAAGTLTLTGTQSQRGNFSVNSSSVLELNGIQTLNEGVEFNGEGLLRWRGTVNLAAPIAVAEVGGNPFPGESNIKLELSSATINGSAGNSLTTSGIGINAVTLSGSNTLGSNAVWNNSGDVGLGSGYLSLQTGSQFNNLADGHLDIAGSAYLQVNSGGQFSNQTGAVTTLSGTNTTPIYTYAGGTATNAGTIAMQTAASVTLNNFSNAGMFQVASGNVELGGVGNQSGAFNVVSGSNLKLSGTQTLDSGFNANGLGTMTWSGTVNLAAPVALSPSAPALALSSVTINGSATNTLNTAGTGVNAVTATGSNTLGANTIWNNGGQVAINGGYLSLQNGSQFNNLTGAQLDITGTGYVLINSGGFFYNQSGGAVNLAGSSTAPIYTYAGGSAINAGALNMLGTVTAALNNFGNAGSLNINSGNVEISGTGTHSGSFNVASGSNLALAGSQTLSSGVDFAGMGSMTWGGAVNLTTPVSLGVSAPVLHLSSATITGSAGNSLNTTGTGSKGVTTVGSNTLGADTVWNNGGDVTINGGYLNLLNGSQFNNQATGHLDVAGNGYVSVNSGSQFHNQAGGVVDFSGISTYPIYAYSGSSVINAGTVNKQNSVDISLNHFNNAGTVNVNSGNFALAGTAAQAGSFNVALGSKLELAGNQTLNTGVGFAGSGSMDWTGTVNLAAPVAVGVTAPALTLNGATINGSATNMLSTSGTGTKAVTAMGSNTLGTNTVWNNGGEVVMNGGYLNMLSGSQFNNQNGGTVDVAGAASVYVNNGAQLHNQTGGVLNLSGTNTAPIYNYSGGGVLNEGTVNKQSSSNIGLNKFDNAGQVNITSGNLELTGAGVQSGSFAVAAGSDLKLSGNQTLNAGTDFSGAGSMTWTGTVNLATPVAIGAAAPALTLNGATVNGSATNTLATSGTGSKAALLIGSNTLGNNAVWNNGGELAMSSGSLSLQNGSQFNNQNGGSIDLGGTASVYVYSGAQFQNQIGGVVNLSGTGGDPLYNYSGGTVHNAGIINKQSAGNVYLNSFQNAGQVNVTSGNLELTGTGAHSGTYTVASGSNLKLSGNQTLNTGTDFSGTGSMTWTGTVNLAAPVAIGTGAPALTVNNATVNGSATNTLTTTGSGTSAVALTGYNTLGTNTVWNNGGEITLGSGSLQLQSGSSFNNHGGGSVNIAGDSHIYLGNSAVFNNHVGANVALTGTESNPLYNGGGSGVFNNAGTVTKSNTIDVYLDAFDSTGLLNVASGGAYLNGTHTQSGGFNIDAGARLVLTGTQTLAPGVNFSGAGTVEIASGIVNLATSVSFGNGNPALRLKYATIAGSATNTLTTSGTGANAVKIVGSTTLADNSVWNNTGTVEIGDEGWATGHLGLAAGSVFNNQGGTVLLTGTDSVPISGDTTAAFNNAGVLTKSGSGQQYLSMLNNAGSLNLDAGQLHLSGYGNHSGNFNVAAGTNLTLSGVQTLNAGTSFAGAGAMTWTSGDINLGAPLALGNTAPELTLDYVDINGSATNSLTTSGTGARAVTVTNYSQLGAGTVWNNAGDVNIVGNYGGIDLDVGSQFNNLAAGVVTLSGDSYAPIYSYGGGFNNAGALVKTSAAVQDIDGVNNHGTLSVNAGTLNVGGTAAHSGTFHVAAGATLEMDGEQTFNAGTAFAGDGQMVWYGDINLGASLALGNSGPALRMEGVYLSGSAVNSLNTSGTGAKSVVVSDYSYLADNAAWNNSGTVDVTGQYGRLYLGTGSQFNNAAGGTLNLTSTAGTVIAGYSTNLVNAGTLSGFGTIDLGGGTLTNNGLITPGGTAGVGGALAGGGGGVPGVGMLSIVGNYAQGATGTLAIELGGATAGQFDRLNVSGNVALNGTLNATLVNGYVPAAGNALPFLPAGGSRSGSFSTANLPAGLQVGYSLYAGEAARLSYVPVGPSTHFFDNTAGDFNWANPANWNFDVLPTAGDEAVIDSGIAVTHGSGTHTVNRLTINSANSLNVSGGSLTVVDLATVGGSLAASGSGALSLGSLTGTGSLSVNGGSLTIGSNAAIDTFNQSTGSSTFNGTTNIASYQLGGGVATVNGNTTIANYSQTGGSVGGGGNLAVTNSFNQPGGVIAMSGSSTVNLTQASGNLVVGPIAASMLALAAPSGAISQTAPIQVASLLTQSATGTALTKTTNQISSIAASNTTSGAIDLVNSVPLSVLAINNAGGGISVDNTGGVITSGPIQASGAVVLAAHSPLTIGAGGVTAGGNISLTAGDTAGAGDNLTLSGAIFSSGGGVMLSAGDTLQQSANVGVGGAGSIGMNSVSGSIVMAAGTQTISNGGAISVTAPGDITLSSLNAGTGSIALTAGGSVGIAAGQTGPNLVGSGAVVNAGSNVTINTSVQQIDVTAGGTFQVVDTQSGAVISNAPSTPTTTPTVQAPINEVIKVSATPTTTSSTTSPVQPTAPSTQQFASLSTSTTSNQTTGGTAGTFGGGSTTQSSSQSSSTQSSDSESKTDNSKTDSGDTKDKQESKPASKKIAACT